MIYDAFLAMQNRKEYAGRPGVKVPLREAFRVMSDKLVERGGLLLGGSSPFWRAKEDLRQKVTALKDYFTREEGQSVKLKEGWIADAGRLEHLSYTLTASLKMENPLDPEDYSVLRVLASVEGNKTCLAVQIPHFSGDGVGVREVRSEQMVL